MDTYESNNKVERKVAGALITVGSVAFLTGAFIPITNKAGAIIYALPAKEWPAVISDNSTTWAWATALLLVGVLLTAFGAALISDDLRDRGERLFSRLGSLAIAFASLLLVIEAAFRLSSASWAQEAATNSSVLDFFVRISDWLHVSFMVYSVLMVAALAAYGASILRTSLMPRWSGWTLLAYSGLALIYILITADSPPFTHYLMLLLIGVLLLRPVGNAKAVNRTSQRLLPIQENKG